MTSTVGAVLGRDGCDLSVMIPTYECVEQLTWTLRSLRGQGIDAAQVEVVDDHSVKDDYKTIVERLGGGSVGYHRHPRNLGMVANFNSCIERAERRWVHVLHGDDVVLPGGYAEVDGTLGRHQRARVCFGRSVVIDDEGRWISITPVLGRGWEGAMPFDVARWALTPVQFAGVMFEVEAAREVGGFDASLSHTADWDLWWRLARSVPVAFTNRCIGGYRESTTNHSSSLRRSARNIEEGLDQLRRITAVDGDCTGLHRPLYELAVQQGRGYAGDAAAVRAHQRALLRFPRDVPRLSAAARLGLAHLRARRGG